MNASAPTFCPECGAPAPFRGTAISLVCEYCSSTIVRTGVDITLLGKVSAILDTGSPILLDAKGTFDGVPFQLAGRLQIRYERGTWNEWFVTFADGRIGWLSDAQGNYAMMVPVARLQREEFPPVETLAAGAWLTIRGASRQIVDVRGAAYQGAEGILPFVAQPGTRFYAIDLRGPDKSFATIDFGSDPGNPTPDLYVGRAIQLDALGLRPLRRFEGWS